MKWEKVSWIFGVILIIGILLAFNLSSNYVWFDEAFTLNIIKHSYGEIIHLTSLDVHPFLYYFIAKFLSFNVTNVVGMIKIERLVTIVPYIILEIYVIRMFPKRFNNYVAVMFSLIILIMPGFLQNSFQIRMYSWAMLFVTFTFLYIIYLATDKDNNVNWILAAIFALLAAYTHYFAGLSVAILYSLFFIYIILERKYRLIIKWSISVLLMVIGYLPWLFVLYGQLNSVGKKYWIKPLTSEQIIQFLLDPFSVDEGPHLVASHVIIWVSVILITLLISCIIMGLFSQSISLDQSFVIFQGFLAWSLLNAVGIVVSIIFKPIYMPRYEMPMYGVLWLSLLLLISTFQSKTWKILITALIIIIGIWNIVNYTSVNIKKNQAFVPMFKMFKDNYGATFVFDGPHSMYESSIYTKQSIGIRFSKGHMFQHPELSSVYGNAEVLPLEKQTTDDLTKLFKNNQKIYVISSNSKTIQTFDKIGKSHYLNQYKFPNSVSMYEIEK